MLEKLGEILRKTTNKITNAIFLDKNLVEAIVRDLQRALIEADVNISLVKEISDKLRKAAYDERIKEIEKKEHLIKILHDELMAILGEYKPLKLGKDQNRIMFLGLYGAGKCVHGESKIQLSNGNIAKVRDLYQEYENNYKTEKLEDGEIIDISNENLSVPSFNPKTLEIENKKATHLWKLKKDDLMEIKLENGNDYSIKVTPEHPFFILRNGAVLKVRADELTEQDYVSIPNEININGKLISLFNKIKDLNLDVYTSPKEAKKQTLKRYNTLKEAHKSLKFKKNYCQFTLDIKNGKMPLEFLEKENFSFLRVKGHKDHKTISVPLSLNQEFAEFIGYVIGDGHIGKNYIEVVSEDAEVINRFTELSKMLFNISPSIKKDKRTKKMYKIQLCSGTLVGIFKIFGLKSGKKGKELKVPEQIMLSDNETIRSFIRAYFDCDSYPSKNKRQIELTSESQILIQQTNLLLRRFGILSTISKKMINEVPYWRLIIKARYTEIYAIKIGYLIKRKQTSINRYKDIGVVQGSGNQDMVPIGKTLKALRLQLGFSIGEIQENAVYSYGIYEEKGLISREQLKKLIAYYKLKKQGIFWALLKDISNKTNLREKYSFRVLNGIYKHLKNEELITQDNNLPLISNKGQKFLQTMLENQNQTEVLLRKLECLSQSSICWTPIKEINKTKNDEDFVYDLTVEDNHSFIAEGCIVHNTTTISKLGNYYAKRGNKVALVGLDVHRPAASEQLKQLAEKNNLAYFIDPKEKDPIKIWKKHEKDLKDYNIVLIDTAGRHTLDKELIDEIKNIKKVSNPNESILVITADIGQAAKQLSSQFQQALNITGVIITRMDSTAKGGGALTACAETKAPVYFIGTGEKVNDLEEFNPSSFLSRLLGMGDLQALIEKIKSVTDEGKQEKMQKRLEEGNLSLEDVVEQVKSMGQLGGFDKIKSMIPGLGSAKIPENMLENQQAKIAKWEHILKSMTPEEKSNPELLKKETSRIARVAKGSGVNTSDIRSLLKQYDLLNDMIKSGSDFDPSKGFSQKQMQKMAKKFGKKMRF